MADIAKLSQRDSVLVNILERMSDQLEKQNLMLEDIVKQQIDLNKAGKAAESNRKAQQIDGNVEIGKLRESISRYRSDMLSLVNEQDHINKNIAHLSGLVNSTVYAFENANQKLAKLEQWAKAQEKTATDHYAHSLKQAEILPKAIADSTRSISKLHMDTEKSLGKMHQETQRQLEKLQQDTVRRLLVLGDIESALQTLLIRTEPPEKKPFWLVRLFRMIGRFFRTKFSRLLAIIKH